MMRRSRCADPRNRRSVIPRDGPGRCGWWLIVLLLACVRPQGVSAPSSNEGLPFMQAFTPRDYQANTPCYSTVQDARGIVYVSSLEAVLEYDGSAWRKTPATGVGHIGALAYEAGTDRVFVGGINGLGYLEARPGGGRTFVSLLEQLPADERAVGPIRAIYCTVEGVFFVGAGHVLRWREGRFKVWPLAANTRLRSGWVAGHLYVQNPDLGLLRLDGDAFASASADGLFRRITLTGQVDRTDGTVLAGTAHDGLFSYRTDGTVVPAAVDLNDWLKTQGVLGLRRLHDGSLAVVTETAGLLLLDREGHFRNRIDHAGGLHGDNLFSVYEDAEGGLWIGLQSGITRAEIDSPLSILLAFRQTRAPGLPGVVHADVNRLRQVLFNLLSNAVKFTRAGTVSLAVSPAENGRVRFEVGDTGVGIAADQLDAIFTAFHQTGEHSLAMQGTGLGLAISQRLVRQMGGEIQVESTPGQGSRFWFALPMGEGTAVEAAAADDARGRTVMGYEGAPRSVLIVDDQPENRRVLRDLLQPLGLELEEAVDGEGCLAACGRRWPDAVLLDLRLGGALDGFEVASALRARAVGKALGIVAVSASVFEDARQQAVASGCDDFLPKPFEEGHLLAVLGRVLGLRWTYAASPSTPQPPGADATADPAPPADVVEALLELSSQGDVIRLREQLDALRAPGAPAGGVALARTLDPLVANYQMDLLHETLLRYQAHARP